MELLQSMHIADGRHVSSPGRAKTFGSHEAHLNTHQESTPEPFKSTGKDGKKKIPFLKHQRRKG